MFFKMEHCDVYYGQIQALYDINVEINPGEIISIIGATPRTRPRPMTPFPPPRWRPPGWIMPPLATFTAAASGATAARCARGPAA